MFCPALFARVSYLYSLHYMQHSGAAPIKLSHCHFTSLYSIFLSAEHFLSFVGQCSVYTESSPWSHHHTMCCPYSDSSHPLQQRRSSSAKACPQNLAQRLLVLIHFVRYSLPVLTMPPSPAPDSRPLLSNTTTTITTQHTHTPPSSHAHRHLHPYPHPISTPQPSSSSPSSPPSSPSGAKSGPLTAT